MNITELIKHLQEIKNEHGDLCVYLDRYWSCIDKIKVQAKEYHDGDGGIIRAPLAVWIE